MRHQTNASFTQLGKEELATLTSTVNEVIAVGFRTANNKTFSAADLWNIQRQKRSFVQRRNRY